MDKLSVDLIHKIFMWIPIKSLLKARCVSKSWCNIIDDPFFAHLQYNCGKVEKNTLLLATSDRSWPNETSTFYAAVCSDDEDNMMIRAATVPMVKFHASATYGSCNGLLYFADDYIQSIVVSNPLKSKFTILPPTPFKMNWISYWSAIGLGFDSSTKTFKMVCTNQPGSTQLTIVHTLGTTSWREVPSVRAYYCGSIDDQSVYVHGFLHWMINPLMLKNGQGRILAFDLSKETFEVVPHPKLSFETHMYRYFRILDFKGNLGMFDLSHETIFDLWVMDYEKKSWSKEYIIDITIVGNIYVDITQVKGLWKQDKILFHFFQKDYPCRDFVRCWSYSMRTGNIKECEDQSSKAQVYSLKGSLISVPGAMKVS